MNNLKNNIYTSILYSFIKLQIKQKGQFIGRISLYLVIVYLFSQVFNSVNGDKSRIWYVSITQLITLSTTPVAFQILNDFKNRQFEYFLLRPTNYIFIRCIEAFGSSCVNYTILWFFNIMLTVYLTNYLPDISKLFLGIIFGYVSMFIYIMLTAIIGLSSYWIKDIKNIFYLNMTASFCLGGLIVPLEFYSGLMQQISFLTPYPWILWAPAQIVSGEINLSYVLLSTLFWVILIYILTNIINRLLIKNYYTRGF